MTKKIFAIIILISFLLGSMAITGFDSSEAKKVKRKKIIRKVVKKKAAKKTKKTKAKKAVKPSMPKVQRIGEDRNEDAVEQTSPSYPVASSYASGVKTILPLKNGGIGIQTGMTGFGLSVKYKVNPEWIAQGIYSSWSLLGITATVTTGRGLYIFQRQENMNIYAGGELTLLSYSGGLGSATGFGAFVGIEYFLQGMPDLGYNFEIGYGAVPVIMGGSSYGLGYGAGIIYYFF